MLLSLKLAITDTARMQRRVYETVERPSVRLSVCHIIRLQQRRAPGRRYRSTLTSRIPELSIEIFIRMSTRSGSKRQRSDRKMRFVVENHLHLSRANWHQQNFLLASTEKHRNNARFSGLVHSVVKLSLVDKSMGKRRRNCHS